MAVNHRFDLIDQWTELKRGKDAVSQSKQRNQRGQGNQDRPESMDLIGVEKFLQVQGYTYYGCAYAQTDEEGGTSCGFIKKELLHLIPFYDLYQMKKDLEERYKTKCKKYQHLIRYKMIFVDIHHQYKQVDCFLKQEL